MRTLLLLLAPVASADDTYRPPVVPTPQPAEAVPSPYEGQLVVPAVDVASRVAMVTKLLGVDVRGLATGAGAAKALALQLAADPRWRVVDWDGGRVAYQRVADGKGWTVPLRGYHTAASDVWRKAIVLRPWAATSVWATSPVVGRAAASATQLALSELHYAGNATGAPPPGSGAPAPRHPRGLRLRPPAPGGAAGVRGPGQGTAAG